MFKEYETDLQSIKRCLYYKLLPGYIETVREEKHTSLREHKTDLSFFSTLVTLCLCHKPYFIEFINRSTLIVSNEYTK